METLKERIAEFLDQERIAVAGLSAEKQGAANLIYHKLKATGHQVFGVNPNLAEFEGEPVYPDLQSIPGGVGGVVIVTKPAITEQIVEQCPAAGVSHVWMHQSLQSAGTSVSKAAVEYCNAHGIEVIAGACPMMYVQPVDFGHKLMRGMLSIAGGLPK